MSTIKKLPDGRYYIDTSRFVMVKGEKKRKRKRLIFDTLRDARTWDGHFTITKNRERNPDFTRYTIEELCQMYYSSKKFERVEVSSAKRYRNLIKIFTTWCSDNGIEYVDDFTPDVAEKYDTYLSKRCHNRGYRAAFAKAKELFIPMKENPFSGIALPKITEEDVRWLEKFELEAFFTCCNPWQRRIFRIMYYTGMRTKELRYLRIRDIAVNHDKPWIIRIEPDLRNGYKLKAKGSRRAIPVHEEIHEDILWFLEKNKGRYYFVGSINRLVPADNDHPVHPNRFFKNYEHIVKRVSRKFGIDISDTSPHSLRKTCGAHHLQNGTKIQFVSKFLGHASIAVTEKHYVGLLVEDLVTGMQLKKEQKRSLVNSEIENMKMVDIHVDTFSNQYSQPISIQ